MWGISRYLEKRYTQNLIVVIYLLIIKQLFYFFDLKIFFIKYKFY